MEREDDVQLIHAVLSGDDSAFGILVEKYQKSIHALAWRKIGDFHYAEEITQDTFLRVYQNLSTLRNPNQFSGWLYVIANRLCLHWLRKQKPAKQLQSLEDTPIEEIEESAYTRYVLEQRETEATEHRFEIVKKLLEKLPEGERTAMTLYYLGEMTTKEISKCLGVSVEAIRTRLHRARKRLQDEEKLLVFPEEDWTEEEFQRWREAVVAAAVNVNLLDITGCVPDPVIIEVELGESIQIYNGDATDHTLHWGGKVITVPAGETIDIVVSDVFPTKGGFLGYGCDDGPTAGIFYVVPPQVEPINPLLVFPEEDWTDEERQRWWEAVRAAAVNVNLLNIIGCVPDPVIIEVELGESIQIYNDDATDHTLHWGGIIITVPAGETIDIVVSDVFPTKGGVLGYGCDGTTGGIFYVVPPQVEPIHPLLVFPEEDWTDEEFQRWAEAVTAAAVNVNLLDITGCTPDPLVLEVELGESIQIYNDDATDHTLHWGGKKITVPAHDTIDIVVSDVFPTKGGVLGYGCDDGPTVGIFYVVEPPPIN